MPHGQKKGRPKAPRFLIGRDPPAWSSIESSMWSWPQEIHSDIFMLIYEGNKHPVYVKLLLHYGPYQGWVGIFAYSVFAIIVGLNVKGHRTTSQLTEIGGLAGSLNRFSLIRKTTGSEGFLKPLVCPGFSPCFYVNKLLQFF